MVIIIMGPMGCGKTTIGRLLAEKLQWDFEDGDDFHPPGNVKKMHSGVPLDDDDRLPWLTILHDRIVDGLAEKRNFVLACSALKKNYRQKLGIDQVNIFSVYLKGSRELLQERINARTDHYMNSKLLGSQIDTLEEPQNGLTIDIDTSPDGIVDTIITRISTLNNL